MKEAQLFRQTNRNSKDNWEVHFNDTVVEGVYISNWRMAELLARKAPDRVYELEQYGALFDRTPEGKISQRAFGAHTYRRLCHVGDRTPESNPAIAALRPAPPAPIIRISVS